jgi:hypothetical protein
MIGRQLDDTRKDPWLTAVRGQPAFEEVLKTAARYQTAEARCFSRPPVHWTTKSRYINRVRRTQRARRTVDDYGNAMTLPHNTGTKSDAIL